MFLGIAALGARPASAAAYDRLAPFLGRFQGQSGQAPGALYVPLWSKPNPFDVTLVRHQDELVFAVGGTDPVMMRFVPVSDRLYVLRTDRRGETGYAWVDQDTLTVQRMVGRTGMRFVVRFEDDHRRLAAYTIKNGDAPVEVLDTVLKGAED
ncbi:MAG TPA: hypothetical protein VGV37_07920 [Aliidongia sp.]|uniref:hypothetical protein n=1 Tax=Aliidongia sp. TaxID=1914230 RepID=UPI002DDCCC57|nr:hypothetical protein [Aliidongia sp.]HEV2674452.1 hypothetical protein [Aliidongia sp.]